LINNFDFFKRFPRIAGQARHFHNKGEVCHYQKDVIPKPGAPRDAHTGSFPSRTWWNARIAMNPGFLIRSARIADGIKDEK
jgi:hypothetical protein